MSYKVKVSIPEGDKSEQYRQSHGMNIVVEPPFTVGEGLSQQLTGGPNVIQHIASTALYTHLSVESGFAPDVSSRLSRYLNCPPEKLGSLMMEFSSEPLAEQ